MSSDTSSPSTNPVTNNPSESSDNVPGNEMGLSKCIIIDDEPSANQRGVVCPFPARHQQWIKNTFPEFQRYLGEQRAWCDKRRKLTKAHTAWIDSKWEIFLDTFDKKKVFSRLLAGKSVGEDVWKEVRHADVLFCHLFLIS